METLVNNKVSEEVLLDTVQKIVNKYAHGYTFGIYDRDDIAQEMMILALEVMPKYDGVRSLYKFLSVHIHNRLNNLKRNKWFRATCPCKLCDNKQNGETGHPDKLYCKKFISWKNTNNDKCSLAAPVEIPVGYDNLVAFDPNLNMSNQEISDLIDENLPVELRETYLRIKSGLKTNKKKREEVLDFIRQLMNGGENGEEQ